MAVENYTVQYIADATSFVAGSRRVEQSLLAVESQANKTKKAVSGFAGGAGRSASSASKNVDRLTTSMNSATAAATAARSALQGVAGAAASIAPATSRATSSVNEFLIKSQALHAAKETFQAIMEASKELEKHWQKMAEEATEFRDSLRELANIRGKSGPDNEVVADVLDFSLATGMVPEKAREFAQSYENIGPTVRDKGHYKPTQGKPEDLEREVTQEAGRTARRMGLDEKAAGEAIGSAGLFHTFTSKEQAMDIFGGALRGLSQGKLEYTPGVRALNKSSAKLVDAKESADAGALPGRVGSFDEAGIYLGAMSLGTGTADQAGHRMVQNSRVLNPSSEEGKAAMAGAGITPEMNDPQRLIALSKHLKANNVQDVRGWLQKNNMGSESTREGFEASLKVADVLEKRLKDNQTTRAGKQTIADNEKFMGTDRAASAAKAETVGKVVDQVEGEKVEPLERAKKFADSRRRMGDTQKYDMLSSALRATVGNVVGYLSSGVGAEGMFNEQDDRFGAIPNLKAEGAKFGVDVTKQFPGIESGDYQTRATAFKQAADEVQTKSDGKADPYGERKAEAESRARVKQMRPAAPAADAAAGGNGAAAPAGPGQKVASIDADKFDRAVGQLASVSQALGVAARNLNNGRPLPGADFGGSITPIRT